MNIFGKVLVVVVFLLSVGFAVSQMILFEQRVRWRDEYERETDLRQDAERARDDFSQELERLKDEFDRGQAAKRSEIADLEQDIADRNARISSLESDLERRSEQLSEAQRVQESKRERLSEKDNIIEEHEATIAERDASLKRRMDEIADLEEQVRMHTATIDDREQTIAELDEEKLRALTRLGDRERQLAELEARGVHVDIGKPLPVVDGVLSRVDNEIGVAVLNRGKQHGVEINYDFVVYRDDAFVARVYVMDVFPEHSLERVDRELTDLEETPMQVGDRATTRIR